jgi:hypothetical protein
MARPSPPPVPLISADLMAYLNHAFPTTVGLDAGVAQHVLLARVGHAQVIAHLQTLHRQQTETKD